MDRTGNTPLATQSKIEFEFLAAYGPNLRNLSESRAHIKHNATYMTQFFLS